MFMISSCNEGRTALDMKIESRETEQILVPPILKIEIHKIAPTLLLQ